MNLASISTDKWENNVNKMSVKGNPFNQQVTTRMGHAFLAPASMITNGIDAVKELGCTALALVTLGHVEKINDNTHSKGLQGVFVKPFEHCVKIINPKAKFNRPGDKIVPIFDSLLEKVWPDLDINKNSNFFMKKVVSRLENALLIIAAVVASIANGVLGILAAALSFLTLGCVEPINHFAQQHLESLGTIPAMIGFGLVQVISGRKDL